MKTRWLAVVILIVVVLGAAYAIYQRNREAVVNDDNTSNSTAATATPAPGMAAGSPYEISTTGTVSTSSPSAAGTP